MADEVGGNSDENPKAAARADGSSVGPADLTIQGVEVTDDKRAKEEKLRAADSLIKDALQDPSSPPRQVHDQDEAAHEHRFDPMQKSSGDSGLPDSGVNIVNSFVNRTVFFDYFRHVANKRFPDKAPAERVQELVRAEPKFYNRTIWSDYILKITTSAVVIGLATALFWKAIFG
ncbi:hypothetical protein GCM10027417_24800 [Glutamicibacter endophyticus]